MKFQNDKGTEMSEKRERAVGAKGDTKAESPVKKTRQRSKQERKKSEKKKRRQGRSIPGECVGEE